MSNIIELSDYRDITPKEDEIRLPEDGFVLCGLAMSEDTANEHDLVEAHKWFSLAAMRGSHKGRVHRLDISARMSSEALVQSQQFVREFMSSRI